MNLISTMLGFIGRKIKNLETEVGKINSTLDDVSPAPKVIPIERGGTGCTTLDDARKTLGVTTSDIIIGYLKDDLTLNSTNLNGHDLIFDYFANSSPLMEVETNRDSNQHEVSQRVRFNFNGFIRIDFILYLFNGFTENSLVTLQLTHYAKKSNNENIFYFIKYKFNTRPVSNAPYTHFMGSKFLKVNAGEDISLDVFVSRGGGVISGGGYNIDSDYQPASNIAITAIKTS